jgi:hypothetical protein
MRGGEFSIELFRRYQRSEQALVLTRMEMVVTGGYAKSDANHQGVVRDFVFQVHGLLAVQGARSDYPGLEFPFLA